MAESEAQKEYSKLREAAFETFMVEWRARSPIMNHPAVSDPAKAAAVEAVREVFYAGFASAYSAYVLLLLAAGKKPSDGT